MKKLDEEVVSYLEWCAQKFLSYRPRSEFELTKYLREKITKKRKEEIDRADAYVDQIMSRQKELNNINDEEFVEWWVHERTYFKPRGEKLLVMELRQKGIKPELISNYFSENPVDEEALLSKILVKKAFLKDLTIEKERVKLTQHLLRRGFSYGQIKKAIEESLERE